MQSPSGRGALWRATLALVLVALTSSCTKVEAPASGARHSWTQPDTLRIATSAAPNTLNPILSTTEAEVQFEALVFDPLVTVDERGRDVPILATEVPTLENGGISRDGLSITYHLRHGVRWQDGQPFSSRDVAFTFHAIMNPATLVVTRHGYDQVAHVDTPDAYTAVFRLKRPFGPAVHTLFGPSDAPYFILPAHLLERFHDLNRIPFDSAPVGTGPFKVARWLRGDRVEYVANDDYFLGKPKLRRIVFAIVPDENTISSEVKAHEVDWFYAATPRVYPQLASADGVTVHLVPLNAYYSLLMNNARAPFDDPNVRHALALAVDKRQLVREASFGTTVAATEDLPSFMWAFNPSAGTVTRNLPRANALLDAAGWKRGPDGIRVKEGKRFSIVLSFRTDSVTDRNVGVELAAMLKEAGIETTLKGYVTSLLYGPPGNGIQADGKYDVSLQTWYAGADPDDSSQLTCDQVAPKGYDWTRYCDRSMDAAQQIALSHYDEPTRKRAYATVESLLARDNPEVYIWWPRQIEAVNTDLKGFRPNGIAEDWNAYQWSI